MINNIVNILVDYFLTKYSFFIVLKKATRFFKLFTLVLQYFAPLAKLHKDPVLAKNNYRVEL